MIGIFVAFLGMASIFPIAWIITGDDELAWNIGIQNKVVWFLINLPWAITGMEG